jgi:hypothetical protein
VQAPQVPFPSQTMLAPQLVPPILLLPSAQVMAPDMQEVVPFLQMFGLPVQDPPAVQATQAPEPLQTMLAPQLRPGALSPPSTQVMAPDMQEVAPFLQMLGLPVQDPPAVQGTQAPEPSQTRLVPQLVPGVLLPPSTQVIAPDMQEVVPFLQRVGLVVHPFPDVHEMHVPEPLHTMLVPQLVPPAFAVPFTHIAEPDMQEATPL